MRWLFRTTLNAALTLAPFLGSGCTTQALQMKNVPQQAHQDTQKMTAQQMLLAQREEAAGNLVEARKLYTRIHQANPDHAECAHRLGLLYVKLNLHPQAEVYYRKALEISPNDSKILTDIGHLAFLNKDYAQSEEYLVRATNADSTNRTATYNLAVVRAWLEEDEASLATFRNIVDEHDALRNLATIQIARGDKSLGLKSMKLAEVASQTHDPSVGKQPESFTNTALLVSAKMPELSGTPTLLSALPESSSSAQPQPTVHASRRAQQGRLNGPPDIPPPPAVLPAPTVGTLSSPRCNPTAVACFDTPTSTAVVNGSSKPMIAIPESVRIASPAIVVPQEKPSSNQVSEDIQFELPYRSSMQVDCPDQGRLSWEILKSIELKSVE